MFSIHQFIVFIILCFFLILIIFHFTSFYKRKTKEGLFTRHTYLVKHFLPYTTNNIINISTSTSSSCPINEGEPLYFKSQNQDTRTYNTNSNTLLYLLLDLQNFNNSKTDVYSYFSNVSKAELMDIAYYFTNAVNQSFSNENKVLLLEEIKILMNNFLLKTPTQQILPTPSSRQKESIQTTRPQTTTSAQTTTSPQTTEIAKLYNFIYSTISNKNNPNNVITNNTTNINKILLLNSGTHIVQYVINLNFYGGDNNNGGGKILLNHGIGQTESDYNISKNTMTYISFGNLPYPNIKTSVMIKVNKPRSVYINCSYTMQSGSINHNNLSANSYSTSINLVNYSYNYMVSSKQNIIDYINNYSLDSKKTQLVTFSNRFANLGNIKIQNAGVYVIYYSISLFFNGGGNDNGGGELWFSHGFGDTNNNYKYFSQNDYTSISFGNPPYPSIYNIALIKIDNPSTIYINCQYQMNTKYINNNSLAANFEINYTMIAPSSSVNTKTQMN